MKYLITFNPIEPYFFGDENTFRIGEESRYFISSKKIPSASTVLGTMRYELLKSKGFLATGHNDSTCEDERAALVGPSSYTVGENTFGAIKSISPLFLMKGDEILIKTPLNHKIGEEKNDNFEYYKYYTPMQFANTVKTSLGDLSLPKKDEFNAKSTVDEDWYVNLNTSEIYRGKIPAKNGKEKPIFDSTLRVGIGRSKKDFFKKVYCTLNSELTFAVVADIEYPNNNNLCGIEGICYMGRERSAFKYKIKETRFVVNDKEYDDINAVIENELGKNAAKPFRYVFGDAFITEPITYKDFAIVRTGTIRMLSSKIENGSLNLTKGDNLYNTVGAGSVFYGELPQSIKKEESFGFNSIIEIQ